jgi:acetate kinase
MPEGKVIAKGLVEKIGETISKAKQTAGNKEIELEQVIKNHDEALLVMKQMLVDPEKGALKSMTEVEACGHRVVHGGEDASGSLKIDERVEKIIEQYSDLAPLHNPPNLTGIKAAKHLMPEVPQVACFDTAFHTTLPEKAYLYALPYEMYEKFKIRRYGFHGISHGYIVHRASMMLGKDIYKTNVITCHLGNGCSMSAVKDGKSIDTTMGLTPLEGLVMGTRTGDLDPAIIFYLIRKGYKSEELDSMFNKKSGLLGISGISNDVRDLEEKAKAGEKRAQLALDIFAYRVKKYIGAYLAVLNGTDAIILTGGIGENAIAMRKRICENMEALGIKIDDKMNKLATGGKEMEISTLDSKIKLLVIPTNEEAAIAADTYTIVTGK